MRTNSYPKPALYRDSPGPHGANRPNPTAVDAMLEFGRFRVLLRRRQLVADGVPIELGTRALDILLVLLEADGSLVTKDELMSRIWPGIFVAQENLKVQISVLRRALGADRDLIRTEFGRGYRFTAAIRSTVAGSPCQRTTRRGTGRIEGWFPGGFPSNRRSVGASRGRAGRRCDPAHTESAASCRHCIGSTVRKGEKT
jgi:DNA-binding winged helix-turn-helix (wHTH) protein